MISLLAALGGFLSSLLPEVFKIIRDKNDKKHELALFEKQIEIQKLNLNQKLDEISYNSDIENLKTVYQTYKTNINFIDALNGAVRPLLAYSFFALYSMMKYFQYHVIGDNAPLVIYIETLWTQDDQAIFAGIISFYFGQRNLIRKR
ncbi:MAG: hypothetical protein ACK4OM_03945 [Alphaproteobacteria bacterium]